MATTRTQNVSEYMLVLALCLVIIILHCSTTYLDVAYYYRPSIMVCLLVCRSVTVVSPAKAVETIEMPFGLRIRVGPRNYALDGGSDPPWDGAVIGVNGVAHCIVATVCCELCKKALTNQDAV